MELSTPALRILLAVTSGQGTSTTGISERVGISQQSVSRLITELTKEGYVQKTLTQGGLAVAITPKGWRELTQFQEHLAKALNPGTTTLQGNVEKGIGEGRYYISRPEYNNALTELLGHEPFPGTLNIHVEVMEKERFLATLPSETIQGFSAHGRTYGAVRFYPVKAQGIECGLVLPVRRSHGPEKVELVSAAHLRHALNLKDGDTVTIERRD